MKTKFLTRAGIIAAIYVVLILIQIPLGELAYGPIQLRIAEGLTLLPLVESAAVPGLFIGCLIGNMITGAPFGLIDIIGGSLVTLLAAYLTSKMKNKYLGALAPVLLNGLIISIWVSKLAKIPYWPTVATISLGELIAVAVFGNITLYIYNRVKKYI